MNLSIPQLSLVVLVGPSGAGKSTFARKHFRPTEVLSSDDCRAMVGDDPNDQGLTKDAFEVLHFLAAKRLARGKLTVIDATSVQPESRNPLVELGRRFHCLPVAVVLDVPEAVCQERNRARPDRDFGAHVVRNQCSQLRRGLRGLKREGFSHVFTLHTPEEIDAVTVERTPLWSDRRDDRGPFDLIGDVHGCATELEALLAALGYAGGVHPAGRKAVFVGDLVDRGPRVLDTLGIVRAMVARGSALCVPGNHDVKLLRKLRGKDVRVSHGLAETLAEIDAAPGCVPDLIAFLDGLVSHYVLDGGRLVVAHAGMKEEMQGRGSSKVRDFALYGETTGETDEFGLPVRLDWASEYKGTARVVYGHTPVPEAEWHNRTMNLDTGCVFGGKLTALRYPEMEVVSVPAARVYCEPVRPVRPAPARDDTLAAEDVTGKRVIATRLRGNVTVREAHAAAALEVMSRWAIDPRWLIYLPPTMSPSETSREPGLLEHPAEAFAYFRAAGVDRVVCEEKHMGSRAVAVVCRDDASARERFGVEGESGVIYTRTGRRFFTDGGVEAEVLARLRAAATAEGLWDALGTTWLCLDCELMPWSAKAQDLLRVQYAAVGSAGAAVLPAAVAALERFGAADELLARVRSRRDNLTRFVTAYRRYCWPVSSAADLRLAPFHLLASEGKVHADRDHVWHMTTLAGLCAHDPMLVATPYRVVDPADPAVAVAWWEERTAAGGEGMVVKPLDFVARGPKGLVQPAVKVRGREYLRIIYGPDYTDEANLARLRSRGLGAKRSLALNEFALGVEGLERFVARDSARGVHECVFGVLALESEPVDPRL
ncbi:MAG: polynucleotide kinase-phosphatase [Gemmataceae bacterium]